MVYKVKEIYLTLQGEGFHSGRKAVFCRFSGCNLWNGLEKTRISAKCSFCDTDFVGFDGENGGKYTLLELSKKIDMVNNNYISNNKVKDLIVFTGGEPLLQLNEELINNLKKKNYEIAVETNGTLAAPKGIDWICVSPKIKSKTILKSGNELKLVYPQKGLRLKDYENLNFDHFYLQPLYDNKYKENLKKTLEVIMKSQKWKLSLQTHKYIGIN